MTVRDFVITLSLGLSWCLAEKNLVKDPIEVALVDLNDYFMNGNTDVLTQFDNGLHNLGFVGLINHNLTENAIQNAYDAGRRFFDLEESIKLQYTLRDVSLCGYTGIDSLSTGATDESPQNVVETYFLQLLLDENNQHIFNQQENSMLYEDLSSNALEYTNELRDLLYKTNTLASHALNLNTESHFNDLIGKNGSLYYPLFTYLNYPPKSKLSGNTQNAKVRLNDHTDVLMFTFVKNDGISGLQLKVNDTWYDTYNTNLHNHNNIIWLFSGDAVPMVTNNYWKSIHHRIVWNEKNENQERLTMSFFTGPDFNQIVKPLDYKTDGCFKCTNGDKDPLLYEPQTVEEIFRRRFDAEVYQQKDTASNEKQEL